ncbi:MAG: NAD(P)-dependent oxidoreductase [Lachnospiraceae bacterium]|nr:hydroxyacid dehydrogenase [Candidatus Fimimorpha excrementavium]
MNIVLLESLGIGEDVLERYAEKIRGAGHSFAAYERTADTEKLIEEAKEADVLILANMPLGGEVIRACPHLKYIDVAFTGVDHVDLEAARQMGVSVSNASGYSNDSVAELTLCMVLSLLRNVREVEEQCRCGGTKDGLVGSELRGKTVGIIGTGAIGSRSAELCRAFGCRTIAYNGFSNKADTPEMTYLPLHEMLEQSDVVLLHCPVSEKSRNLINQESISHMKKTAILVNAARGPVVDSQALAEALNEGRIAGAGIDVFEQEPPIPANHPLLRAKHVLATPHVAFATKESMEKRAAIVFDNLEQWLNGTVANRVL